MSRISGIDLKESDRLIYALTKIKGIGWSLSKKIMADLGLDEGTRVGKLDSDAVSKIQAKIEEYPIEGDLLRIIRSNIQRLKQISSYRGIRHTKGLPVRGQRTRTNARTKRGKRKTVGAFKKEALSRTQVTSDTKK